MRCFQNFHVNEFPNDGLVTEDLCWRAKHIRRQIKRNSNNDETNWLLYTNIWKRGVIYETWRLLKFNAPNLKGPQITLEKFYVIEILSKPKCGIKLQETD